MNHQKGKYHEEMMDLYDRFVEGRLNGHYTSYFPQLKEYFLHGNLITRIHALEMILNLVLGGKWTGVGTRPVPPAQLSDIGQVQEQLLQIERHWETIRQQRQHNGHSDEAKQPRVKVGEIVSWLEEVLPLEQNKHVLKVYFIFIKTHWEHLSIDNKYFERLYKLHHDLLESTEYAKLEALERLHRDAFTKGYHPLR